MAVFRIEKTRDYTVMSNHHLRDTDLSLKSKGLLSIMLSLPEDWKCAISSECFLQPDSIVCHMKVPKEQGGQERYSNLVLLHRRYLPLLTDQDAAALKSICKQLTVTRKQLTKINNLRTAAKLAAI